MGRRSFTEEFRREVVESTIHGGLTNLQAARRYEVSVATVRNWTKKAQPIGGNDSTNLCVSWGERKSFLKEITELKLLLAKKELELERLRQQTSRNSTRPWLIE